MSESFYDNIATQLADIHEPILLVGHAEKNPCLSPLLHQPYINVLFDLELLNELIQTQANNYKLVVFDHILSKLDFLVVLDMAKQLLSSEGELYLVDNITQNAPTEESPSIPHIAPYFIAQAQRCGFELVLNSSQERFTLLQFKLQRSTRWRILPVAEQQKTAMLALFKQVFGSNMSNDMWQWKYGHHRGVAVGVWQQEQMVAHYGGMQRRLSYFGEHKLGMQIGDVMVLPTERGRLTKHGPFFLSASTFSERHVGYGTPHFIPYGFPNARHIRVAEKLGIYAKVDDVVDITWDTLTVARKSKWQYVKKLEQREELQSVVNKLWAKMYQELQQHIALVRDWEYIEYRYLQRPEKQYTFLAVYNVFGQPVGLVIIAIESDYCRFMDYIGCFQQIPRVMHQVCAYLQQQDIEHLGGWFSAAIAEHFARSGGQVSETEIILPTIVWGQGVEVEKIKQRWWLTTGDTDFL
ncbi:GNAT family N-acetyltransferase [Candidatus Albibeggiatoa sp. nov. NOAA]|uniref:GNAT family N-acetyltransferase n=1 Tax=Candidatus Albibeggiatoa sp. nov. NOAA TaxID=3162724 RepID=UPI0032F55CC9|nr:GNAT family N-acetyltransferase [Thiotrichaceae bacterium]